MTKEHEVQIAKIAEEAVANGDKTTASILFAMLGAASVGMDKLLALRVRDCLSNELLPMLQESQAKMN